MYSFSCRVYCHIEASRMWRNFETFLPKLKPSLLMLRNVVKYELWIPANKRILIVVTKKKHSVKNTIIANATRSIWFVGPTFGGSHHDYKIFKEEFPTEEVWFEHLTVLVDLGYQGIIKDYY